MKKIAIVLLFVVGLQTALSAQMPVDCAHINEFLTSTEKKIARLNPHDPELIALHYLFMQEIQKELQQFAEQTISQLTAKCPELPYYGTVSEYDRIAYLGRLKMDSLTLAHNHIDVIFYERAQQAYANKHNDSAFYFLNRALQYNKTNPDILLMKCQLSFEERKFSSCLNTLQILYHECQLTEDHENSVSDFNMLFYTTLYQNADSLMKIDLASDALLLFKTLETFCTNLPPQYCNDDYYHGILRSKKGVYESYLKIARVAKERGFSDLEMKFLDYAEAYRKENEENLSHLMDDNLAINQEITPAKYQPTVSNSPSISTSQSSTSQEDVVKPIEPTPALTENHANTRKDLAVNTPKEEPVPQVQQPKPAETVKPSEKPKSSQITNADIVKQPVIAVQSQAVSDAALEVAPALEEEPLSPLEIELKEIEYFHLFFEAIDYCLKEDIEPAYLAIKKALELEQCDCFAKDARVGILYESLHAVARR